MCSLAPHENKHPRQVLAANFKNKHQCLISQFYAIIISVVSLSVLAKSGSSHVIDVNEALKKINRHLTKTFEKDFPLYLVLAYKIHK